MGTISTYGAHAEAAARALTVLISLDAIPAAGDAVDQMLHFREGVVDALRQRLHALGHDDWSSPVDHLPAAVAPPSLAGLDDHVAGLVDNIAFALPCLPFAERRVDDLATPCGDPTADAWRIAAAELLAGSRALTTSEDQSWRTDPGAAWWVMRDVAVALEAVVVLDARLEEVGLLAGHQRPQLPLGFDERRMVLSQAARVATWHATSTSPDHARPRQAASRTSLVEPVTAVTSVSELADAQKRLARFLLPMAEAERFDEPEITADCARYIVSGQMYLCRALAAVDTPAWSGSVEFFRDRAEMLEVLQGYLSHVSDLLPLQEPNMRRFWQQSAMTTAVQRLGESGAPVSLQPEQLAEMARATHAVTQRVAIAIRSELLRSDGNLRDVHPEHPERLVRVGRGSQLDAVLTDLANRRGPSEPAARFSNPLQRAALAQTLALSPAGTNVPSPFPVSRFADHGAPAF